MSGVTEEIKTRITKFFDPVHFELINESHLHKGHRGDDGSGESHFKLMVVSERFFECGRIQRHRMIHEALKDLMKHRIHALSLYLLSPEEYKKK